MGEKSRETMTATLDSEHVAIGRHHVYWCEYRARMSQAEDLRTDTQRDGVLAQAREAQGVLDRIGWPGDDVTDVDVDLEMLALIRRAVLDGLRSDARELDAAIYRSLSHPEAPFDWHHRGNLADIDAARALLDNIGWELS